MKNKTILSIIRERIEHNTGLRVEFLMEMERRKDGDEGIQLLIVEDYQNSIHALEAMLAEDKVLLAHFSDLVDRERSRKLGRRFRRLVKEVQEEPEDTWDDYQE